MTDVDYYSNSNLINVAAFYPGTHDSGPGKRAVIWLQGCLQHCAGCVNPTMQPLVGREWVSVSEIAHLIISLNNIEGITIYGGEPFLQYRALAVLLTALKTSGLSIMIYTGYLLEELQDMHLPEIDIILSHTDILVDGPFIQERNHGEMWRGSDNQRIHFLSEHYKEGWSWVIGHRQRTRSLHYTSDGSYVVIGIPA